jgi:hypothetical protein
LRIFLVVEANSNLRSTVFGFVYTVAGPPILKPQLAMLELETVVEVLEWTKYKRSLIPTAFYIMFRFEIGINVQSVFSPSGKCNTKNWPSVMKSIFWFS